MNFGIQQVTLAADDIGTGGSKPVSVLNTTTSGFSNLDIKAYASITASILYLPGITAGVADASYHQPYLLRDDESTQAPASTTTSESSMQGTLARVQGFDGTNFRRILSSSNSALLVQPTPVNLIVTATAAANTAVTLTIPAAGAGLFHYIIAIDITRAATAALAGTALLNITTTNLPGSPAWTVGNAMAAGGTQLDVQFTPSAPIKSSAANTATTIVAPAPGVAVSWRINAWYYTGT